MYIGSVSSLKLYFSIHIGKLKSWIIQSFSKKSTLSSFASFIKYFFPKALIGEFSLNKKREELFLKFYFKNYSNTQKDKLKLFKTIYINICKLWFKMN